MSKQILDNYISLSDKHFVPYHGYGTSIMHKVLTMWLFNACKNFKIKERVYLYGISILNRYLHQVKDSLLQEDLQGAGMMCIQISSCIREIEPEEFEDWVYISDSAYTVKELEARFGDIVKKLDGKFYIPTAVDIQRVIHEVDYIDSPYAIDEILILLSFIADSFKYSQTDIAISVFYLWRMSNSITKSFSFKPDLSIIHDLYQLAVRSYGNLDSKLYRFFENAKETLDKFVYDPNILIRTLPVNFAISIEEKEKLTLPTRSKLLGKGTYGSVVKTKIGKLTVAVKSQIIENICEATKEIVLMKTLKHKNIQDIGQFTFEEDSVLFSMPLRKTSLWDKIDPQQERWSDVYVNDIEIQNNISRKLRKKFTIQLLKGLSYLHSYGIIHADIKSGNLLITETNVLKIADFGMSKVFTATEEPYVRGIACTPIYRPYDLLKTGKQAYSFGIDIWSAAVVIMELETGISPFYPDSDNMMILEGIASSSSSLGKSGESEEGETYEESIILLIEYIVGEKKLSMVTNLRLRKLLTQMFSYQEFNRITAEQALVLL